jgi:hypothetical protein
LAPFSFDVRLRRSIRLRISTTMMGGRAADFVDDAGLGDTIRAFEATGSPVITDGEQREPSFDTSTSRDTAFARIRSRVEGTQLAARALGC